MILQQLSIRIEKDDLRRIELKVKNNEFKSISDFIRFAISEQLKGYPFNFIFDEKKLKIENNTNVIFIKE